MLSEKYEKYWNSHSTEMTKKDMDLFLFCIFAVIVTQQIPVQAAIVGPEEDMKY